MPPGPLGRMVEMAKPLLHRALLGAEDWMRYNPTVRRALSTRERLGSLNVDLDRPESIAHAIVQLCTAARLTTDKASEYRLQNRIVDLVGQLDVAHLRWELRSAEVGDRRIKTGVVLKPFIAPNERGVIFVSFETQWLKLLQSRRLREFTDKYRLVIAPSSSPHNLINYVFAANYPDTLFTLLSNPTDQAILPRISSNLRVVPLYASSWVNPDLFDPRPRTQREYDLIMVANWGKAKRHHSLFSALRNMPRNLRVLLIGQDQDGRTAESIQDLARMYGVVQPLTVMSNQPYGEVVRQFCNARASVMLSRREGSCVAVTESFFADTPVGLLRGAEIGSRVFINDQTGALLEEERLAEQLSDFIAHADNFNPRAWALRENSCHISTQTLNRILRDDAGSRSEPWTEDLATLQWSPHPVLASKVDAQRFAPERERIRDEFGFSLGLASVSANEG